MWNVMDGKKNKRNNERFRTKPDGNNNKNTVVVRVSPSVISISSGVSFWLSRSTMWFIIRCTGLVLDFLFLFRLLNGIALRLWSEFLSAITNFTGLLSVRPISATTVNRCDDGTCVGCHTRSTGRCGARNTSSEPFKTSHDGIRGFEFRVNNDSGGGRYSRYTDTARNGITNKMAVHEYQAPGRTSCWSHVRCDGNDQCASTHPRTMITLPRAEHRNHEVPTRRNSIRWHKATW